MPTPPREVFEQEAVGHPYLNADELRRGHAENRILAVLGDLDAQVSEDLADGLEGHIEVPGYEKCNLQAIMWAGPDEVGVPDPTIMGGTA